MILKYFQLQEIIFLKHVECKTRNHKSQKYMYNKLSECVLNSPQLRVTVVDIFQLEKLEQNLCKKRNMLRTSIGKS